MVARIIIANMSHKQVTKFVTNRKASTMPVLLIVVSNCRILINHNQHSRNFFAKIVRHHLKIIF